MEEVKDFQAASAKFEFVTYDFVVDNLSWAYPHLSSNHEWDNDGYMELHFLPVIQAVSARGLQ